MRRFSSAIRCGVLGFFFLSSGLLALEVPYLSSRVVDEADLLDPSTEGRMVGVLEALERDTGAQVVVLTLPSLEGEVLEDFSLRVVETWALGQAERDNGLLILVARDDRKIRIEVGYGLEAVIPDLAAHRIIDQRMVPRFREGDFPGGIDAAVVAVDGALRGDPEALPQPVEHRPGGEDPAGLLFMAFVIFPWMWTALVGRGVHGWFFYFFFMPISWAFGLMAFGSPGAKVTLGIWVVLGFLGRLFLPKQDLRSSRGGGGWGGGWSSGGGSSGGFSGGGGSFGGGGSSGSW